MSRGPQVQAFTFTGTVRNVEHLTLMITRIADGGRLPLSPPYGIPLKFAKDGIIAMEALWGHDLDPGAYLLTLSCPECKGTALCFAANMPYSTCSLATLGFRQSPWGTEGVRGLIPVRPRMAWYCIVAVSTAFWSDTVISAALHSGQKHSNGRLQQLQPGRQPPNKCVL
jgi:hypothetical protein